MSSRKSQNSVLFLATLGVYLGLVLTGATPVLGHAATARQFDIRDEIEFADEFDNKPDDEKALEVYASALESVFRVAADIAATHPNFAGGRSYEFDGRISLTPTRRFETSYKGTSVYSGAYSSPFQSVYLAFPHGNVFNYKPLGIGFGITSQEFEFKIAVQQADDVVAANLVESYAAILPTLKERQTSAARALIYESTQISSKDNQVFIVTRLPRAGLESLLANDAK